MPGNLGADLRRAGAVRERVRAWEERRRGNGAVAGPQDGLACSGEKRARVTESRRRDKRGGGRERGRRAGGREGGGRERRVYIFPFVTVFRFDWKILHIEYVQSSLACFAAMTEATVALFDLSDER